MIILFRLFLFYLPFIIVYVYIIYMCTFVFLFSFISSLLFSSELEQTPPTRHAHHPITIHPFHNNLIKKLSYCMHVCVDKIIISFALLYVAVVVVVICMSCLILFNLFHSFETPPFLTLSLCHSKIGTSRYVCVRACKVFLKIVH